MSAVCGSVQQDLIRSLGIEQVFDYQREDFTQQGQQYDFIFDAVGKRTFGACKPALKARGVYGSSELGPGGQNLFFALWTPLFSRQKVIFPAPFSPQESVNLIRDQLAAGHFKPLIDRKYPLEEIRAAYEYVESGQKIGNVLITIP
ncbi:MAG: zinc-binding dehydrogenase [Phaeodactylibacter sp.]|nr:zinc-binding dehydrogenase [Phaeodactylibacter sp.]